jgi:hypothetical protein
VRHAKGGLLFAALGALFAVRAALAVPEDGQLPWCTPTSQTKSYHSAETARMGGIVSTLSARLLCPMAAEVVALPKCRPSARKRHRFAAVVRTGRSRRYWPLPPAPSV